MTIKEIVDWCSEKEAFKNWSYVQLAEHIKIRLEQDEILVAEDDNGKIIGVVMYEIDKRAKELYISQAVVLNSLVTPRILECGLRKHGIFPPPKGWIMTARRAKYNGRDFQVPLTLKTLNLFYRYGRSAETIRTRNGDRVIRLDASKPN